MDSTGNEIEGEENEPTDAFINDFVKFGIHDDSIWGGFNQFDQPQNESLMPDNPGFDDNRQASGVQENTQDQELSNAGYAFALQQFGDVPYQYNTQAFETAGVQQDPGLDGSYQDSSSMMYYDRQSLSPQSKLRNQNQGFVNQGFSLRPSNCARKSMPSMSLEGLSFPQQMIPNNMLQKPQSCLQANGKYLNVLVVPLDPNLESRPMTIKIKGTETSLKQIFTEDYFYWTKVFKGYSPVEPPGYSVFRKALKGKAFQNMTLQILLLKCEGHKFPRNPNAIPFEQHCETLFYGPLVVSTNCRDPPYGLSDFTLESLEELKKVNLEARRVQPNPADISSLVKFQPVYNKDSPLLCFDANEENLKSQYITQVLFQQRNIRSAAQSFPFAQVDLEEMMENLDKDAFFIFRFKTEICPNISMKHNYKDCLYFHNPKDYRRKPDFVRYYPENCPNGINCPNSQYCDLSHSLFENLYHPLKFKVNLCDKIVQDVNNAMLYCIRGDRCAFYHDENDQRKIATNGCKLNTSDDNQSIKSSGSTKSYQANKFVPFSPHEDISPEADVYQRKHARSDYLTHGLSSLSQPVAIGMSRHSKNDAAFGFSGYGYPQNPMFSNSPPVIKSQFAAGSYGNYQEYEPYDHSEHSDNGQNVIYANHLFEGNSIPSRQKSYSENTAHMINSPYKRGHQFLQPIMTNNAMQSKYGSSFVVTAPQGFDSHGVGSTTPSSEKHNRMSKPESDHLKYLFDNNGGYERRADSLKSPVPPGLASKYRMEESHQSKSQLDFSEFYCDKLESKFIFTTQRKITEDREKEDLSQNSSDEEKDDKKEESPAKKPKLSLMSKRSGGFIPKHLRQQEKVPIDIEKLVDSTVNSRKQSEVSNEGYIVQVQEDPIPSLAQDSHLTG